MRLSRYAPHINEEQRRSQFVLGLEGSLATKVESLRPISPADTLIRAKSKLATFRLRFQFSQKRGNCVQNPTQGRDNMRPRFHPAQMDTSPNKAEGPRLVRANNVNMNPSPKNTGPQCSQCQGRGHIKKNFPENTGNCQGQFPTLNNLLSNQQGKN